MKKRSFVELRGLLLHTLRTGQKTINQVASETGINWKTAENHLVYLLGRGYVKEVLNSEYARIFELTETGEEGYETVDGIILFTNGNGKIRKEVQTKL